MRIKFKKLHDEHIKFVHNSWMHSAYLSGIAANELTRIIPKLAEFITLATIEVDGEESIIGWICAVVDPAPCVIYAYVKEPFRRAGVFNQLARYALGDKPGIVQWAYEGGKLTKMLAMKHSAIHNPFFLVGRI